MPIHLLRRSMRPFWYRDPSSIAQSFKYLMAQHRGHAPRLCSCCYTMRGTSPPTNLDTSLNVSYHQSPFLTKITDHLNSSANSALNHHLHPSPARRQFNHPLPTTIHPTNVHPPTAIHPLLPKPSKPHRPRPHPLKPHNLRTHPPHRQIARPRRQVPSPSPSPFPRPPSHNHTS